MEKLPAHIGWDWVKEGFALFRKQPAEMSTLFLLYFFLMLGLSAIPVIGEVLPMFLVPAFSMAFMQACVQIEQGKRIYPTLLLTGFRSPAFPTLLTLGVLYLLAAALAIAASTLVDGGFLWKVLSGQIVLDEKSMQNANMLPAMLVAAAVYVPAAMAFWYAAPLAAWQDMRAGKAIFYSFFAVWKTGRAFLTYGLAWAAIGILAPAIVSGILAAFLDNTAMTGIVLLPLSILMSVIMYCSFYPTYVTVFGRPESTSEPFAE